MYFWTMKELVRIVSRELLISRILNDFLTMTSGGVLAKEEDAGLTPCMYLLISCSSSSNFPKRWMPLP